MNGIHAALHAGLGIGVLAESRIPASLTNLSGRYGLPSLGHVHTTLVANPRTAREPVEALMRAILRSPSPADGIVEDVDRGTAATTARP